MTTIYSWAWTVGTPFRIRDRLRNLLSIGRGRKNVVVAINDGGGDGESNVDANGNGNGKNDEDEEERRIRSRLLVVKLGEYGINPDGSMKEDESWEGREDPFVSYTPEERAEVMNTMTIGEIVEAGRRWKREVTRMEGRRRRRGGRMKRFIRPNEAGDDGEGGEH